MLLAGLSCVEPYGFSNNSWKSFFYLKSFQIDVTGVYDQLFWMKIVTSKKTFPEYNGFIGF